jgi:hypothetical protein
MNTQPSTPTSVPPLPAADPALGLGLGDWQGSSQELRAGLFMQELADEPGLWCWPATAASH